MKYTLSLLYPLARMFLSFGSVIITEHFLGPTAETYHCLQDFEGW